MADAEIDVFLGDVLVGHLRERSYRTTFSFVDEYIESPNRPVLGQWFEDRLRAGPFRERHGGLPVFFENLLPSEALRLVIKIQHQLDDPTDLEILSVVGEDLPGATILRDRWNQRPVGFEDTPRVDVGSDVGPDGVRFSLAGLHLKFSLVKEGHILTLPARGEHGLLIVKIPLLRGFDGIVENEHAVMTWAEASGFEVPRSEIITAEQVRRIPHEIEDGTPVYCVERFDRHGHARIHQEDLAQVLGIDNEDAVGSNVPFGYGGLGYVMGRVLGTTGLDEYFRRIALMVASGNEDAHIKNWSILYPNGHTPRWSPLYDQVSTIVWGMGRARGPALRLGGAREWHEIDTSAITRLAREAGADEPRTLGIVEQALLRLKDGWRDVQDRISMLPHHRRAIVAHWQTVPLLRRIGPLGT